MQGDQPQQTVLITKSPKSVGIAVLLTILFGPLGLFYSTMTGAVVMLIIAIPVVISIFFAIGIILYPLLIVACIIWSVIATNRYNDKLMKGEV